MRAASGPVDGGAAPPASSGGSSGASNRRSMALSMVARRAPRPFEDRRPPNGAASAPRRSSPARSTRPDYDHLMADALQEETAEVLGELIRFDTVNPPGNERACQEWL